jgi:hypothetical protein
MASAMDQATRLDEAHERDQSTATPAAVRRAQETRAPAESTDGVLHGYPLIAASAALSSGQNMITTLIYGPDNEVTQIRVLDASTHQVIAACPPDTIARAQREMIAYQRVARAWGRG